MRVTCARQRCRPIAAAPALAVAPSSSRGALLRRHNSGSNCFKLFLNVLGTYEKPGRAHQERRQSLPEKPGVVQPPTIRMWVFSRKKCVSNHRSCSFIQDETEARIVHRTLTELVEQQDPSLLGANLGQVRHDEPSMCVRVLAGTYQQAAHRHAF